MDARQHSIAVRIDRASVEVCMAIDCLIGSLSRFVCVSLDYRLLQRAQSTVQRSITSKTHNLSHQQKQSAAAKPSPTQPHSLSRLIDE